MGEASGWGRWEGLGEGLMRGDSRQGWWEGLVGEASGWVGGRG